LHNYSAKEAGIAQWYSAGLRAGWSELRVPSRLGIFLPTTTSRPALEPTQSPIKWVSGLFPWGQSGRGVKLTTHLHLESRSTMRGPIPPLSQYAFTAWCSV